MSTTLRSIYSALSAAVATAAGSVPVAWENAKYEPQAGTTFLEPEHIADDVSPGSMGLGGLNLHRGMLRINVVAPVFSGAKAPLELLDTLRTTFSRSAQFTSGSVTVIIESSSTAQSMSDKVWIRYPLFITWRSHVLE